ncbi:hypothetical protein DIPPA_26811 [Diplonema papillatum]|nr:hypothetical protein DIPPA_26811 [Diplonema papillatum]
MSLRGSDRRRASSRHRRRRRRDDDYYDDEYGRHPSPRRGFPTFDRRDRAPEDFGRERLGYCSEEDPEGFDNRSAPLVRGTFRLEGVDFSKYEGLKAEPEVQRAFTSAVRDDLISEVGNGVGRDDILLRLGPGPIKTVVLDYQHRGRPEDGPQLVEADWSMDVEYAIAARSPQAQLNVARALYESLSHGLMRIRATRSAYARVINPGMADPSTIAAVPCRKAETTVLSPARGRGVQYDDRSSNTGNTRYY